MDSDRAADDGAAPSCVLTRDSAAIIRSVDDGIGAVLGWSPDDLVGQPSTAFIHPEDQPTAVAAWFDMLGEAGSTKVFRGRYRAADGSWRWLEVFNENRLEDPDDPIVVTTLVPVTVQEVGITEELRARKQMLAMLADALPVGIFQFDRELQVTFANDQLHTLVGNDSSATLGAAFSGLDESETETLMGAVAAVFAGQGVDALELRSWHQGERARVFEVSMRPLTTADGAVTGAIGCLNDVTERVSMRCALEHEAMYDSLTQCLNRTSILALLDAALQEMNEADGLAVLFVDLDHFKAINDDFGHAAGDGVLVEVTSRLSSGLRHHDALGRLGGDEFLLVCPGVRSRAAAEHLARRIEQAVDGPFTVEGHTVTIAATIGLAWTPSPIPRELLISESDQAMYAKKRDKRPARSAA